jgi:hypothetical protein
MDFVSMVDKEGLLVLKDGFSAFVLLWWADEYSAATAEAAVVEWSSLFGVPSILVTDGGSHFDNQLITALTRRFRSRHHITTAYSPWANGIVERVNRELVRLWKVLMGEVGLPMEEWATIRPLVQAIINRSPSAVLDGLCPAEVQFARKPPHPLDTIAFSSLAEETKSAAEDVDWQQRAREYFETAAAAIQSNWVRVRTARERRREQNVAERERAAGRDTRVREARAANKVPQFAMGEFVLVSCPVSRNKLRNVWMGPYRVVDTINPWVYVVEDIVTAKRRSIHVQRMRLYADAAFKITADTRAQAAYDDQNFVEDLVDWREDDNGDLQIRVRWLGFSADEDTWEPVGALHEDQPELVEAFLRRVQDECVLAAPLLESWGSIQAGQETPRQRRRGTTSARGRNKRKRGGAGGRRRRK